MIGFQNYHLLINPEQHANQMPLKSFLNIFDEYLYSCVMSSICQNNKRQLKKLREAKQSAIHILICYRQDIQSSHLRKV